MATTDTQMAEQAPAREPTLEERMPESVKRFGDAFGRVFECQACGTASQGTCPDCGHTHVQYRADPDQRGER